MNKTIKNKTLVIEITQKCRNSCAYCFVKAQNESPCEFIFEDIQRVIAKAIGSGFNHIHLTGGDPLQWHNLELLLRVLSRVLLKSPVEISLNLCGESLNSTWCEIIAQVKSKISVSVTLNGPMDHHDSMRGDGSYYNTLNAISTAIKHNISLSVFTVVTNKFIPELFDFTRSLHRHYPAIDTHAFICLTDPVADKSMEKYFLDERDFKELSMITVFLASLGYPVTVHGKFNRLYRLIAGEFQAIQAPSMDKIQKANELFISSKGEFSLLHSDKCHVIEDKTMSYKEIFSMLKNKEPDCGECLNKNICTKYEMHNPVYYNSKKFCTEVIDLCMSKAH